ncbi:MAG: FkbM family methyltransferase [Alphaproteobacteria bacterium]|jgi:FkbM family methyltransferase|nr:hypothetical protein [Rhodospirillaceae bacterium]MDP6404825.1 FkbM family methyltransferase [Alphaproteobacteria bacterium]|tara:strand:+ start:601 stop:1788 length:1188 start_codon:yes stop_codon:yes gene_type:complete
MIVDAPLKFPEEISFAILGESEISGMLVKILGLLRPEASFIGFVDDPAETGDNTLVVCELERQAAKDLFLSQRDDPDIIFMPLPVDEMWSYWEFARQFLERLEYDGEVKTSREDFVELLLARDRAKQDQESGELSLTPHCYLSLISDTVMEEEDKIVEVLQGLSDDHSRQVYKMLITGEPEQHWSHYTARVFRSVQYFDYIRPQHCQVVLNGGVLGGYELPFFISHLPLGAEIHNVDPLGHAPLTDYVQHWLAAGSHRVIEHKVALEDYAGEVELPFDEEGEVSLYIKLALPDLPTVAFPCLTMDQLVEEQGFERLDLIKLDLEGAESKMLTKSMDTIQRFRPQLAISIYHFTFDFWNIPLFFMRLCEDYTFHVEVYSFERWETIFYAIPKELGN